MPKETTYAGILGDLPRLLAALGANNDNLPHLDGPRQHLEGLLIEAQETLNQQAVLKAGKQELSQKLRVQVKEAQRVANAVRSMLKQHYGLSAEKLAEFGIQPFRGRTPTVKPGTPPPQHEISAPQSPAISA